MLFRSVALVPLFNWLGILLAKIAPGDSGALGSPYVVNFIPVLFVAWTIVGAIVGWSVALRKK